ncbi:hypothetical protein F66182_18535, partial [Fusarium sp. NRRL 66182]
MSPATTEYQINALQGMEKAGTVIITDTADFSVVTDFEAKGTTNPSLLYLATQQPTYANLINSKIQYARKLPADIASAEDENAFRWAFNNDTCAVEKSADAMRRFTNDTERLK